MSSSYALSNVIQGAGIGFASKSCHADTPEQPEIGWLEILADNWVAQGSLEWELLMAMSERYPIALHGVGLSLGSVTPLDRCYIEKTK